MALKLLKKSKPINLDKFSKITARLPCFFRQNYTLFFFYLSFFCTLNFEVLWERIGSRFLESSWVLLLKYLVVQSLTWALECDRPPRRRSVLLQVLEVDRDEGQRLKRCTRRSKFDETSSNVLVNRQDQNGSMFYVSRTHQNLHQTPNSHGRPISCQLNRLKEVGIQKHRLKSLETEMHRTN